MGATLAQSDALRSRRSRSHHEIHQFNKLAVAAHTLLKILLANYKLLRTTARCLSAAAPRGAQVIRYTATAERSCGWCSSAPGAHPQYHANSLKWQCARSSLNFPSSGNPLPLLPPVIPRRATWGNGTDQQSDEQNARTCSIPLCPMWTVEGVYVLHPGWNAVELLARTEPAQSPPIVRP